MQNSWPHHYPPNLPLHSLICFGRSNACSRRLLSRLQTRIHSTSSGRSTSQTSTPLIWRREWMTLRPYSAIMWMTMKPFKRKISPYNLSWKFIKTGPVAQICEYVVFMNRLSISDDPAVYCITYTWGFPFSIRFTYQGTQHTSKTSEELHYCLQELHLTPSPVL